MYIYTVPPGGGGVVLLQRYYLNCLFRGPWVYIYRVWSIGVEWPEVSAVGGGGRGLFVCAFLLKYQIWGYTCP
jgi:hypothetical protein